MRVKENYVLKEVADTYIVVPIGSGNVDFNTLVTLNETGAFIWKALEHETTKEEILEEMLSEYDVPRDVAAADIDAFIAKVQSAGLLV